MADFRNIHIGNYIKTRVEECGLDMDRIVGFMKSKEEEIHDMFSKPSLDTEILLRWSKLLRYDFFRLYSQHIMLYAPSSKREVHNKKAEEKKISSLPVFRKNIYTPEIITFILELIEAGKKTKQEVIADYKIPKTTLYKWIIKYKNGEKQN